ncbi:MAG: hypothetical protein ACRD88_03875 [Terriglobia bacterium]
MGGGLLVAVVLFFWIGRTLRHSEMRRLLNEQDAFHSPALGMMFPQVAPDTPAHRDLLAAGVRLQFWVVRPRSGDPSRLEVRVTDTGRRYFSPVGNQILATFGAGRREVTRVLEVRGGDQTREVRFRYRWTEIHPGVRVLGDAAPEIGQEFEGTALASFENERWRIARWTTPLEEAVARFRELGTPANRRP